MPTKSNIDDILSEVRKLDKKDQLMLLEEIRNLIKMRGNRKAASVSLTSLAGIGRDVWESTEEIDKYLDEERQW